MDADERARFIHDLKIRLTAISGYAQMVERQAALDRGTSLKQRIYISKLRRLINDLIVEIIEKETGDTTHDSPEDESGGDEPESEGGHLSVLCREPQC